MNGTGRCINAKCVLMRNSIQVGGGSGSVLMNGCTV